LILGDAVKGAWRNLTITFNSKKRNKNKLTGAAADQFKWGKFCDTMAEFLLDVKKFDTPR
jgi:hypothetical protein